jgi:hypothetical protein
MIILGCCQGNTSDNSAESGLDKLQCNGTLKATVMSGAHWLMTWLLLVFVTCWLVVLFSLFLVCTRPLESVYRFMCFTVSHVSLDWSGVIIVGLGGLVFKTLNPSSIISFCIVLWSGFNQPGSLALLPAPDGIEIEGKLSPVYSKIVLAFVKIFVDKE